MRWVIGFMVVVGISVWLLISFLKSKSKKSEEVEVKSHDRTSQTDDNMEVVREKMLDGIKEDE